MKKLLSVYLNWRLDVIFIIAGIALFLLYCEADSILLLILSKIAAIVVGSFTLMLCCLWSDKLPEIEDIYNE